MLDYKQFRGICALHVRFGPSEAATLKFDEILMKMSILMQNIRNKVNLWSLAVRGINVNDF